MDELEKSLVVSACHDHLASQGIKVTEFTDYGRLKEIIDRSRKDYLVPILSDRFNDFSRSNVLWLVGEKDGEVVMLGGARLEDLHGDTLSHYWPRLFRRHYGESESDVILNVNEYLDQLMRGRLVYFGDLFVDSRFSGPKRSNVRAFTMLGHLLTNLRWRQDYTYAFIRRRDVGIGTAMRYGFNACIPRPFDWVTEPFPRSKAEQCAYTSKELLLANARDLMEDLKEAKSPEV